MTYMLRDVPPPLWAAVKARAATEHRSLRSLLLALLQAYIDGRVAL